MYRELYKADRYICFLILYPVTLLSTPLPSICMEKIAAATSHDEMMHKDASDPQ